MSQTGLSVRHGVAAYHLTIWHVNAGVCFLSVHTCLQVQSEKSGTQGIVNLLAID